ncbi:MAG: nuclear transport factor 2 family protein [Acidobacteriota bacterium]|nr:nuclear transport factor 2 family protein [Acidobacteriota bacterium]
MQKIISIVTTLLLITSASICAFAQSTDKKEDEKKSATTVDAWRQALPANEQTSDTPPVVVMEESRNNVEVRETAEQIESRVLDLQQKFMEAFKGRDWVALRQLLADDFMPTGINMPESQADKTRFIDWATKNSEIKSYAVDKTKVRVYPAATAIVTTYYKQKTVVDGVSADADFVATNVWVKRQKQWQAVSHHVSQLPKTVTTVSRPTEAKQNP